MQRRNEAFLRQVHNFTASLSLEVLGCTLLEGLHIFLCFCARLLCLRSFHCCFIAPLLLHSLFHLAAACQHSQQEPSLMTDATFQAVSGFLVPDGDQPVYIKLNSKVKTLATKQMQCHADTHGEGFWDQIVTHRRAASLFAFLSVGFSRRRLFNTCSLAEFGGVAMFKD